MGPGLYFAAWLLAALVAIGCLSAVLTRTRSPLDLRRVRALKLTHLRLNRIKKGDPR